MVTNRNRASTLTENGHVLAVSSEAGDELLDPEQCITLINQREIGILSGRLEVSQCAKTVLDTRADNWLGVTDRLLHHQGGAVLRVDLAEDETAAVDVDKYGELVLLTIVCSGKGFEDG